MPVVARWWIEKSWTSRWLTETIAEEKLARPNGGKSGPSRGLSGRLVWVACLSCFAVLEHSWPVWAAWGPRQPVWAAWAAYPGVLSIVETVQVAAWRFPP